MAQRPDSVGTAREEYISSGLLTGVVREVVGQSWERSSRAGVDPARVDPAYVELDESQTHAIVRQVMSSMAGQLGDEPVSMIFADPSGRVVHRMCPDAGLSRRLEKVSLAPGFSYAEDAVGTNGIGTALTTRTPTLIVGGEHFTEPLTPFACAGAPVMHPVSGGLVGVLDLTCASATSSSLLLWYAKSIANRIEDEILAKVSVREMTLLRDYLSACRHATGPVLALGEEVLMMNRLTQQRLDASDRTALVARTGDVVGEGSPLTLVADLPSGAVARLDYRPSSVGSTVVGGVFRVQLQEPSRLLALPATPRPAAFPLPGAVGTSPEWVRVIHQLREAHRTSIWTIIQAESGTGAHSLARGIHLAESPERHLRVLDAATAGTHPEEWLAVLEDELGSGGGTIIIRHLDLLHPVLIEPVAELLVREADRSHGVRDHWVVATRSAAAWSETVETQLVPCFDRTVHLEPLRHRPEDIRAIVPLLLGQLSPRKELTISARALSQLCRHPWPGNVTQLRDTLRRIVAAKRSGTIEFEDLPPECRAVGRRALTPLEALERDAIIRALDDHHGNKEQAAEHLGMSRATIYRKIRGYDIDARR